MRNFKKASAIMLTLSVLLSNAQYALALGPSQTGMGVESAGEYAEQISIDHINVKETQEQEPKQEDAEQQKPVDAQEEELMKTPLGEQAKKVQQEAELAALAELELAELQAANQKYRFKYVVYAEAAHVHEGGTINDALKCEVKFLDDDGVSNSKKGTSINIDMTNCGSKKEAKGSSAYTSMPPWDVSSYKVYNTTKNAYKAHWIKLYVEVYPNNSNSRIASMELDAYYPGGKDGDKHKTGQWIEIANKNRSNNIKRDLAYKLKRNPTWIDKWENFDDDYYINVSNESGTIDLTLPGSLTGDRFNKLFGKDEKSQKYNIFDYQGAPEVRVYVSGYAANGTTVNYKALKDADILTESTHNSRSNGIKLDRKKLLAYMNKNGVNCIEITTDIVFPYWNTTLERLDVKSGFEAMGLSTRTARIIRKAFRVEEAKFTAVNGEQFTHYQDNYFFNKKTDAIKVELDLYSYNDGDALGRSFDYISDWDLHDLEYSYDSAKLQIGNTNTYIECDKNKSGKKLNYGSINLLFPLNGKEYDSKNVGVKLWIEGLKFKINGQTYYLMDDINNPGDNSYFGSEYKVDTVSPKLTASFVDNADGVKTVNGWRNKAVIEYTPGEHFYNTNKNASAGLQSNYMNYVFVDNDNNIHLITYQDGSGFTEMAGNAASGGDTTQIVVANPANVAAEIEGTLKVADTRDIANNSANGLEIVKLKLDNLAPRYSVTFNEEKGVDSKLTVKYGFMVQDASKSARIYYMFRDSTSLENPPIDEENALEASGEIESLINRWAFVEQDPQEDSKTSTFDSTNGSALLKLQKGEQFTGRIFVYAVDGLGNRTKINSYSINASNPDTDCTITVLGEQTSKPQSSYVIDIDTLSTNKVEYVWVNNATGKSISSPKPITNAMEVGSGTQYDDNGNQVILDGKYRLDVIVTSHGKTDTYSREFEFDNAKPDISFINTNTGAYRKSHSIIISADDEGGIKSATASLIGPDGKPVESRGIITLTPENGIVKQSVTVSAINDGDDKLASGAYTIKVTATDNNGYSATEESFPFYIRGESVVTDVTISGSENTFGGDMLTGENKYTLKLSAKENFPGASLEQHLYYRLSEDGTTYGAWNDAGKMKVSSQNDAYLLDVELDTPLDLTENKLNTIYVQTVVAGQGTNPEMLLDAGFVYNSKPVKVYYDTQEPFYKLKFEDVHTNAPINGEFTLSDNASDEFTVDLNGNQGVISVEKISGTHYSITVSGPVDSSIFVSDVSGNKVEIPICSLGFDFEAPKATLSDVKNTENGVRTDASAVLSINDVLSGSVRFALIPYDELEDALEADGAIKEKYFTDADDSVVATDDQISIFTQLLSAEFPAEIIGESDLVYNLELKGVTGEYVVGVRAADSLGNTGDTVFYRQEQILMPEDITLELSDIEVSPKLTNIRARVNLTFNVPVYVLPQQLITDVAAEDLTVDETNIENAKSFASSYDTVQSFPITNETQTAYQGLYTIYAVDELGRGKKLSVEITDEMVSFGNTAILDADTVVFTGVSNYNVPGYFEVTGERTVTGTELVAPGSMYVDENYVVQDYTVMVVESKSGFALMPKNTEYDDAEGLIFWSDYCEQFLVNPEAPEEGYTKLVYETYEINDYTTDDYVILDKNVRQAEVLYRAGVDDQWTETFVTIENIDNTPPMGDVKIYPAVVKDYETGEPLTFTLGNVVAEGYFSDPHTGVKGVDLRAFDFEIESDEDVLDVQLDFTETPLPYTVENDYFTLTITGDDDPFGVKNFKVEFYKNVYLSVNTVNCVGGVGMFNPTEEGFWIDYIKKVPIADAHYTVEYMYEDENKTLQPITEGVFYKKAYAVINFTELGNERGMYVYNNGKNNVKELNSFAYDYTFKLRDMYGYSHNVYVCAGNFDETPPTLTYKLDNTDKTKEPVKITLTASDTQSGVRSVTLNRAGEDVPLTDIGNGVYEGFVSNGGSHTAVVTDKAGNTSNISFNVTNIDSSEPKLIDVHLDNENRTAKPVTATLYYDKVNTKLTRVEVATGVTEDDISVDYNNSAIRFSESGTVSVWFTDEYGNVGTDTVGVSNIYKTAPALRAVYSTEQGLSEVEVTFEKATHNGEVIDKKRELSEINVRYNGITKPVEETVRDEFGNENIVPASFIFDKNDVYTFDVFDNEGVYSALTIEITNIDKDPPEITQVRWNYKYLDDSDGDGNWTELTESGYRDVGDEAGFRIATDVYPVTNKNVDVTVVTDTETTIVGKEDSQPSTEHTLTYSENGMYIFNMQKANGLHDSYGFDAAVIDKTPPVIELSNAELVFYENPEANETPYNRDMIDKAGVAFKAYDLFGKQTDLSEKVVIDYGNFNPDDISANRFDRTSPYTIKYSVYDDAGNLTQTNMTLRLVGLFDTVALVNGKFPNHAGRVEVEGQEDIVIDLKNFSGVSYARIEQGYKTMGQMKKLGTVLNETSPGSGKYIFKPEENGWYTILVQTDKRDYFNLQIFFFK